MHMSVRTPQTKRQHKKPFEHPSQQLSSIICVRKKITEENQVIDISATCSKHILCIGLHTTLRHPCALLSYEILPVRNILLESTYQGCTYPCDLLAYSSRASSWATKWHHLWVQKITNRGKPSDKLKYEYDMLNTYPMYLLDFTHRNIHLNICLQEQCFYISR